MEEEEFTDSHPKHCPVCLLQGSEKESVNPSLGFRTALTLIWDGGIRCRGRDKPALTCESHVIIPRILDPIFAMAPVPGTPSLGPNSPTVQQIKQNKAEDIKERGEWVRKEMETHLTFLVEHTTAVMKIHDSSSKLSPRWMTPTKGSLHKG